MMGTFDSTAEYEPTNANLLNAASRYLRAKIDLHQAQDAIEAELYDFVREHFPIVDNPWYTRSYRPVWDGGLCIAIDVVQTYSDERGSSSQTFRINLRNEF